MKTTLAFMLTALLTVLVFAAMPIAGEEEIYTGVVRLHVEAASDSAQDQALKIRVRDAVLTAYGEDMTKATDAKAARDMLVERLEDIRQTVIACLKDAGCNETVRVSLGKEYYETRRYGEITLPAGTYTSLRITLGAGEGQNWWCVLYPALCTEAALGRSVSPEEAFSDPACHLVKGGDYALKFRTLEILETLFTPAG